MKEVYIIGGGPSGMMAALSTKMHYPEANVTLIERNERLGKKMRLTGGGRCNVTADVSIEEAITFIPKNGKFLYSALHQFGPQEIMTFFEDHACPLKMEDHRRMFPASNRSHTIVDTLQKALSDAGVNILLNSYVGSLDTESQTIVINETPHHYDAVILATGSKTLPGTGSDGNGYVLAQSANHTITELLPAEVPLVSNDQVIQEKTLQGLSFSDVAVSVYDGKKVKKTITHDLLFAHFGISGPVALRASFYVQQVLPKHTPAQLTIDFLPEISFETLSQEDDLARYVADQGIPKRLYAYIQDKAEDKNECILMLKKFPLSVYDTRGFGHAFVTNGGVSVKEVDPKTMRSKRHDNIALVGELLDYNAFTGGFNITSALATGYVAGKHLFDA